MKISAFIIALFCISSLVACSNHKETRHTSRHVYSAPKEASHSSHYGRVSDIEILSVESRPSGGGAVLGAVIGGVIGHQVGKGTGRDVATGVGVVGGAVAGNNLEKRNGHDSDIYRVTVKFENGSRQQFDYEDINDLRVGDRVKVEDGQIERL
jgi:outer membrane lipoprotein SlyB